MYIIMKIINIFQDWYSYKKESTEIINNSL